MTTTTPRRPADFTDDEVRESIAYMRIGPGVVPAVLRHLHALSGHGILVHDDSYGWEVGHPEFEALRARVRRLEQETRPAGEDAPVAIGVALANQEWSADEWVRYGTVFVDIDEVTYEVGVAIGVPVSLRGTAIAAGGDPYRSSYVSAWYEDAGDWSDAPCLVPGVAAGIPVDLAPTVLAALREAAPRLWREYLQEREDVGA